MEISVFVTVSLYVMISVQSRMYVPSSQFARPSLLRFFVKYVLLAHVYSDSQIYYYYYCHR